MLINAEQGSRVFLVGVDRSVMLLGDGVDVPSEEDLPQATSGTRSFQPLLSRGLVLTLHCIDIQCPQDRNHLSTLALRRWQ